MTRIASAGFLIAGILFRLIRNLKQKSLQIILSVLKLRCDSGSNHKFSGVCRRALSDHRVSGKTHPQPD